MVNLKKVIGKNQDFRFAYTIVVHLIAQASCKVRTFSTQDTANKLTFLYTKEVSKTDCGYGIEKFKVQKKKS